MATNYAQVSDVQAIVSPRLISSGSNPSTTEVTGWITEAEARVNLELGAAGVGTTPVTGTNIVNVLRAPVASYAAARVLKAKHSAEDDPPGGPANEREVQRLELEWDTLLQDIRAHADRWAQMAGQSFNSTAGKGMLRSYQTDRAPVADDKTISGGDFDPKFTRDKRW